MQQSLGFWSSLEDYTWKTIGRLSPALPYIGVAGVGLVMIGSIVLGRASLASAQSLREAAVRAARVGDYAAARRLWNSHVQTLTEQSVLGVENESEELIYPERKVEQAINNYLGLLERYPGHRDLYLGLATLYQELGESEQAKAYWESARQLDPNHTAFKQ